MTTVVIVKKDGVVAIASDTLTCFGTKWCSGPYREEPDKIFRVGESYLGVVGSSAHRLVLESILRSEPEVPSFSGRQEIFELFRRLHPRLKEEYFVNPKEDEKDPYESSQMDFLVAGPHGIFGIMSYREVHE